MASAQQYHWSVLTMYVTVCTDVCVCVCDVYTAGCTYVSISGMYVTVCMMYVCMQNLHNDGLHVTPHCCKG